MRAEGVEPTSPLGHKDLNLARLPVPPRSHQKHRISFIGGEARFVCRLTLKRNRNQLRNRNR